MDTKKVEACEECANCSEHYPSFLITCDLDDHMIKDIAKEHCVDFIQADDD